MPYRLIVSAVALFIVSTSLYAKGNIVIESVKVTYNDNVTNPRKTVVRDLQTLQDNTFWSKPTKVDVSVSIKNIGDSDNYSIVVHPELFYELVPTPVKFAPMKRELRAITNKPTWVWIKALGSRAARELKSGETKRFTFSHIDVRNIYSPTGYSIRAYKIRVYADPKGGGDPDYTNNVKDWIIANRNPSLAGSKREFRLNWLLSTQSGHRAWKLII